MRLYYYNIPIIRFMFMAIQSVIVANHKDPLIACVPLLVAVTWSEPYCYTAQEITGRISLYI